MRRCSSSRTSPSRSRRPGGARIEVLSDIAFALGRGETLGIVGESGAGKSLLALSLLGLLPEGVRAAGRIRLGETDVLAASEAELCRLRGRRIGMIFQDPLSALNPAMRVGRQIAEGLVLGRGLGHAAARRRARDLLDRVRIPEAERRLDAYPHELSGGQRQRVGIAIALALEPALLVADEPTTALDVTVQAEILDLIAGLVKEDGMALILVSHDLGVVARATARTLVLYAGTRFEAGATSAVLRRARQPLHGRPPRRDAAASARRRARAPRRHPGGGARCRRAAARMPLRAALPGRRPGLRRRGAGVARPAGGARAGGARAALHPGAAGGARSVTPPLLDVQDLARHYGGGLAGRTAPRRALDGVSFTLAAGTIMGIVGESGCGKSTLARLVAALDRPTAGRVLLAGDDVFALPARALARRRRDFQMVFQDPYGSLDPRQRVGRIVAEPLHVLSPRPDRAARSARVAAALDSVGLKPADAARFPHAFSGGQRQRIAIARALVTRPKLVIADEPVSALDLSVQAQVLNLILDLRERDRIAVLFITHNLGVVGAVCDTVGVMYLGRIVETGPAGAVLDRPLHPYSRLLAEAEPVVGGAAPARRRPAPLAGEAADWTGCAFRPRCPLATARCREEAPMPRALPGEPGRSVACHHAEAMASGEG